jgi:hypothetical protein
MLTDCAQVVPIPLACHCMRQVAVLVSGIKVQLEVLIHFLRVVFWSALEPPCLELSLAEVVGDRGVDLVVRLAWRFPRPFLDVFRGWPLWPITVCDSWNMSDLTSDTCDCLPVQVMPKSMPTIKSGCHFSLDILNQRRDLLCPRTECLSSGIFDLDEVKIAMAALY